MFNTLVFGRFVANPMGGYTALGGALGRLGRPGEPWDLGRPGIRALLETEDPGRRSPLDSFGAEGSHVDPARYPQSLQ